MGEEILKKLYDRLEYDGWGFWLPEWCLSGDTEIKPSYEEFIETLKNYE